MEMVGFIGGRDTRVFSGLPDRSRQDGYASEGGGEAAAEIVERFFEEAKKGSSRMQRCLRLLVVVTDEMAPVERRRRGKECGGEVFLKDMMRKPAE